MRAYLKIAIARQRTVLKGPPGEVRGWGWGLGVAIRNTQYAIYAKRVKVGWI